MQLFTDNEKKILRRFTSKKRAITEEEKRVINKRSSIGFAHNGHDWKNDYPTAILCDTYCNHLDL